MEIDFSKPEAADEFDEGCYDVEVKSAEERKSKNGDPQFVLELMDYPTSTVLCKDWLTYGKNWGMMKGKLKCLGISEDVKQITAVDLIGCRVIVALKYRETESEGRDGKMRKYRNLGVDIDGGGHTGYWAIDDPAAPKDLKDALPF